MTVGEKIQVRRKELKMSQEELGQKLLVSRQTISLWEKDQTLPTVDNLLRLKQVLGISIDEMLDAGELEQPKPDTPSEAYRFCYSKEELTQIHHARIKHASHKPTITLLCLLSLLLYLLSNSAKVVYVGIVFGYLLFYGVSYAKGVYAYHKAWKNDLPIFCKTTYEYNFFDDHISIIISRDNEIVRESKCFFQDIEKVYLVDKWLILHYGGVYILRKSDLKENSVLYSHMCKQPTAADKRNTLSKILFVASFLSIIAAVLLVNATSRTFRQALNHMWLFFLMTPIPITSAVFGFVQKAKGHKYTKNIVIGIIMTLLLCLYGCFPSLFRGFPL